MQQVALEEEKEEEFFGSWTATFSPSTYAMGHRLGPGHSHEYGTVERPPVGWEWSSYCILCRCSIPP